MQTIAEERSKFSAGFAAAIIGTVLWSTTAVFIRELTVSYGMPPLVLAFWREIGVAVGLVVTLAVIKPVLLGLPRRHFTFLVCYGLVLMLFNTTWTISVALNGAAVSTVLIYSSPAITALVSRWLWGERLGLARGAAILLSMAGCVLVSGAYRPVVWQLNPVGAVLGLLSGVLFAAYSIFGKLAARRGLNPWSTLVWTFSTAPVFLLFTLMLPVGSWLDVQTGSVRELMWLGDAWRGWLLVAVLALGPTIGGYGLYSVSLRTLPASVANLIASSEPVFTAVLAYLFLGERMLPVEFWGSFLIISGVLLLRMRNGQPVRSAIFSTPSQGKK